MIGRRELLRLEVPLGLFGAALIAGAFVFATTGIPSWIPPAPLTALGIPSPLTGMTRSFVALASGDLGAGFVWHPLGPTAFAACVALPVVALASWARERRFAGLARVMGMRTVCLGFCLVAATAWVRQVVVLG